MILKIYCSPSASSPLRRARCPVRVVLNHTKHQKNAKIESQIMMIDSGTVLNICSGFALQMNKIMSSIKLHRRLATEVEIAINRNLTYLL